MDDSVIKVLRRNGSWKNSRVNNNNFEESKAKRLQTETTQDEFKLDEKFEILAKEIKKRMNTKEDFRKNHHNKNLDKKVSKSKINSNLEDIDKLKIKILPYLRKLQELITKRQSYLKNISAVDKELDEIYEDISNIKNDYLVTIKNLKKNMNFFDDSLNIIKQAKEEK